MIGARLVGGILLLSALSPATAPAGASGAAPGAAPAVASAVAPAVAPDTTGLHQALDSFVQKFAADEEATEPATYMHALSDLNGDGAADAVVLLTGSYWCGSGGCTFLVARGGKAGFTLLSRSTVTFDPIRVAQETRKGWKTLIVFSKGRGEVLMRFNGKGYPGNPSTQPVASKAQLDAAKFLIGP